MPQGDLPGIGRGVSDEFIGAVLELGEDLFDGAPDVLTAAHEEMRRALPGFLGNVGSWENRTNWINGGTFGGLDSLSLAPFDRRLRRYPTGSFPRWRAVDHTDVSALVESAPIPVAAAALFSHHPDGYVRQAAVEFLAQVSDGDELPYLLLRAADWVEEVRGPAQRAVRDRIDARPHGRSSVPGRHGTYVGMFAHWLQLIETEPFQLRAADLYVEIDTWLVALGDQSELFRELWSAQKRRPKALISDRLIRNPNSAGLELFERSRSYKGQLGKRMARAGLDRLTDEELSSALEVAESDAVGPWTLAALLDEDAADRAMSQRRLHRLQQHPWSTLRSQTPRLRNTMTTKEAETRLIETLYSSAAAVRDMAQPQVRASGLDPAAIYRAALSSGEGRAAGGLAGLGEMGNPDDLQLIEQHLADSDPGVRFAAVRALRIDPSGYVETFAEFMMHDPDESVRQVARMRLRPLVAERGSDWLVEQLLAAEDDERRRLVVGLFGDLGLWQHLIAGLELLAINQEGPSVEVLNQWAWPPDHWWSRRRVPPDDAEVTDLGRLLSKVMDRVHPAVLDRIRRQFQPYTDRELGSTLTEDERWEMWGGMWGQRDKPHPAFTAMAEATNDSRPTENETSE